MWGMVSEKLKKLSEHHQFSVPPEPFRSRKGRTISPPMPSPMSNLPEEIQVDIFLKLPLNSIGICRCVCKVWCSLLRNPKFIKTQLGHTNEHNNNARVMLTGFENKKIVFCSLDCSLLSVSSTLPASSTTCTSHGTIVRGYPFKDVAQFRILGSCDGLIFVGTSGINKDDNLCIWNPTTGEYKNARLPQCAFLAESDLHTTKYGICYDCNVDDYKLVRFSQNINCGRYQAEVYTVGSELWNGILSNYTFVGLKIFSYRILNGAILCLGFKTTEGISSKVIISFDMISQKFVDFIFPEETNPSSSESLILHDFVEVMNGCLYIVIYAPSIPNRIDVWKMQEYGVRESWTKLFTLTTNLISSINYLKLQWSFASGEVLIKHDETSFLYDPKNDQIKEFIFHGIGLTLYISTDHVESLVSLKTGTYARGEKTIVNGSETKIELKA